MSSTNSRFVVTDKQTGQDWAGGEDWTDRYSGHSRFFPSNAEAKDAYRAIRGAFPRHLTVTEVTEEMYQAIVDAIAKRSGTALTLVEDDDDTVHEGEVIEDQDDLDRLLETANQFHAAFEAAGRSALVAAWNCGQALIAAKAEVDAIYGRGEWKGWVEVEFSGSYRTAAVYMQIASNVQISALSEYSSISGVLKAIAAGKDRPARPERSLETRARNIRAAADKLAQVVAELAAELDADTAAEVEADMDYSADVIAQAFRRIDTVITGGAQ